MPGEMVRAGFRLGFLVLLLAAATLPFLQPASAEFWASVAAAGVALLFIGGLVLLRLLPHHSPPGKG
jgi:hypothetical protein